MLCNMNSTNFNIDTLELVSIQYEIAQSLNGQLELRDFCRNYMETCLRRLSVRAVHLYLPSSDLNLFQAHELTHLTLGRISMPKRSSCFPEQLVEIVSYMEREEQLKAGEVNTELLLVNNVYYHCFKVASSAVLIFERIGTPLPNYVIRALTTPVSYLFNMCNSAIKHLQILEEIEQRTLVEKKLAHIAYHDELTNLPNRTALVSKLDEQIIACNEHIKQGALIYVDLDYFRDINDSLGHVIGDELLKEVAHRLQVHIPEGGLLSRISSDEFIFLCSPASQVQAQAKLLISNITSCFTENFYIDERDIKVSASIGVTYYSAQSQSAYHTLMQGDLAMSSAKKRTGVSVEFYQADMENKAQRRFMLDTDMRSAIARNEFFLVLQPQVDSTGRIIGAECLMRWLHPKLGYISPIEFIEIAEKTGFIIELGDWIIEQACSFVKQLQLKKSTQNIRIAINLSAKQFYQVNFIKRIEEIIHRHSIPAGSLEIELTESVMLENVDLAINKMCQLTALGIETSIDDFGTGYSSLSYLKQLPIDKIKVDRSFVTQIHNNSDNRTIVEAIVLMARGFNLKLIAEGVENKKELDVLNEIGCHEYQGFYFYKPMMFDELILQIH